MKKSSSRAVYHPFMRRRSFIVQHRDQAMIRHAIETEAALREQRTRNREREQAEALAGPSIIAPGFPRRH
jgi:hypothetical protein